MPELRVVINGESTTAFPLTDETVTLGRDAVNTIVLPDKSASSLHAQILAGEDGWQIEDLGSTNGTLVNDRRIHTVYLRDGDRIRIGMTEIVYSDSTDPTNVSDSNVGSIDYFRSMLSSSDGQIDSTALPCFVIDDSTPPLSDEAVAFAEVDAAANPKKRLSSHRTIVLNPAESTPSKAAPRFTPENPVEHLAETKLRLVQQVSEKLVRIFEPQQLLDEIMRIVVDQTGADRGLLCLLDDSRQPFPIAARGMRGDEEIRVSRTVLGRLLEGRKGLLLDPSQEEDSKAFRSLEEMQVQSTMCVPLWTGDRIVGILSLDSVTLGKRFSHQDLELLLAVAHQVAIGIERNRLSQQIETGRHLRDYLS